MQRQPNGLITFCTISCGLISFDGSAWRQFTSRVNPQANNVFYSLLHPDYGLLLATSAGLFRIEKDQVTPLLLGETSLNELCYRLKTRFNSYSPTLPVQMNYDQNSFSLHFFCPSYINETNNRYRYRLTGFEEKWQEIGNRHSGQISYQNLPAGQYLFEIMAANAYEQWGPISRSAGITVRAPFWKGVPFMVLSALIILLIPVWAVFTYSQKRHASRLEAVVESRTEELKRHRHMIRFIIRNLISNATKFTPRSGHITISVYDHSERWSIGIQDSPS